MHEFSCIMFERAVVNAVEANILGEPVGFEYEIL